jgi:predicted dehydrogenase
MKNHYLIFAAMCSIICMACNNPVDQSSTPAPVRLVTLEPGHFHAALVQKSMYPSVDSVVYVYSSGGDELTGHLKRIEGYNSRAENPARWNEIIYTGKDYLETMVREKKGNLVVISGNNRNKTEYIKASVDAGFNVLADKPMAIDEAGFELLKKAFRAASEKKVLLYDIMTERFEITTLLQKELSQLPGIFGQLEKGSPDNPAITKESVHHYYKYVSGSPLKRPAWFFDPKQQGSSIVDVTTHLVDLVQWECFPGQVIDYNNEIEILNAKLWPTTITRDQFREVTLLGDFPGYLQSLQVNDSTLNADANSEILYTLKGVHARVRVRWNFKAEQGGDTHYSIMRGTKATLVIRQGAAENFKPVLYIEPVNKNMVPAVAQEIGKAEEKLNEKYPGVMLKKLPGDRWEVVIPDHYKLGHEAHFAQVMENFLQYLSDKKLPDWEVPNMIAKYYVTTRAFALAQKP